MCLLRICILQFFQTGAFIPVNKTNNRNHRDNCQMNSGESIHLFTPHLQKTYYMILHFIQKINNAFSPLVISFLARFNLCKASYGVCCDGQLKSKLN